MLGGGQVLNTLIPGANICTVVLQCGTSREHGGEARVGRGEKGGGDQLMNCTLVAGCDVSLGSVASYIQDPTLRLPCLSML